MNDSILLGDVWKKIRKSKGYTQEYVAEKLDLGTRYISDLERNKTIGSLSTLIKLCNLYEVTPTVVLQEYLNIKDDYKIDTDLIGYYSLNKNQKQIILKLINFMQE
ncbi:MAG: helix-turn-helix transcriptional regulator [Clostridiales bacterium]|nr:helix-turn-helix transcriptional regulator [Clostridiales bacterium]